MSEAVEHASEARVSALEAKVDAHQNSLGRRLTTIAAIVAFIVSAFTVYDRLVTKPNDEKVSEYQQLKSDIRSIAQTSEEAAEKSSADNGAIAQMAAGTANVITQSYRDDAARMLTLLGGATRDPHSRFFVGAYDFVVLSNAAYTGGASTQALDFSDRAVAAADTPHGKAEALRLKAWMLYQVRGAEALPDIRAAISQGYDALAGENTVGAPTDRAQLFASLSAISSAAGDCQGAIQAGARAEAIVSAPDALAAAKPYVIAPMVAMLKSNAKCPYDGFPGGLRAELEGGGAAGAAVPAPAAAPAPAVTTTPEASPIPPDSSLTCRFLQGPRAGQSQSYAGVAGVRPEPIGGPCADGQGSFGQAQ